MIWQPLHYCLRCHPRNLQEEKKYLAGLKESGREFRVIKRGKKRRVTIHALFSPVGRAVMSADLEAEDAAPTMAAQSLTWSKEKSTKMKSSSVIKTLMVATLLLILSTAASAQATRTWVSGVGDDANSCSRKAPCLTFAGALAKTSDGGVISVLDPGGYGAVTINKSVTSRVMETWPAS